MRRACGYLSLDLPEALEDRTSYILTEERADEPDTFELGFERLPDEVLPSDVILDVRARMAAAPDVTWAFAEGDARAGEAPARTLHAETTLDGVPLTVVVGAFRRGDDLITFTYQTVRRLDAPAVLARALASVTEPGREGAAASGLAWRALGPLAIELPAELAYPRTYLYETPDGGARLVITTERGAIGPPDVGPWIHVQSGQTVETTRLSSTAREIEGLALEEGAWRVDQRGVDGTIARSTWLRQVLARWADGRSVRVLLVETGGPDLGDRRWPAIAASVRPTPPTA